MCCEHSTFIGLTAEGWTALGTVALAIITGLLVIFGRAQLMALREENKKSRTLAVCEKYDTDPVIDAALRNLAKAWANRDIQYNPRLYRMDAVTVLNYLESICSGVAAGVYDEALVKNFHSRTMKDHIEDYIASGLILKMGFEVGAFFKLEQLCASWATND